MFDKIVQIKVNGKWHNINKVVDDKELSTAHASEHATKSKSLGHGYTDLAQCKKALLKNSVEE